MSKYLIYVSSGDTIGYDWIKNIVAMANLGATLQDGHIPQMRFPQGAYMELEADTPPVPREGVKVFDMATKKEVFATLLPVAASEFSLDEEDENVKDLSTNDEGKPWTKEQLDSMDFDTEFRAVCKAVGITGRSRDKMTKEYLSKTNASE